MSSDVSSHEAIDAELLLLRRNLVEMRTSSGSGSGRKPRSTIRRRIARLLGSKSVSVAAR